MTQQGSNQGGPMTEVLRSPADLRAAGLVNVERVTELNAVAARYDIPQRWYAAKAAILGVDRLADYDRMASVAASEAEFARQLHNVRVVL